MRADREICINSIQDYDRDRLLSLVTAQYDELDRLKLIQYENERIYTETHSTARSRKNTMPQSKKMQT